MLPTKLGGGTYAIDLNSNRVLGSIWYWNYGDYNPISHHLCAFPSADPYHSFEFINSTQGGKNSLIYGIPTRIQNPAPGFNIYRVRYDGAQMELLENVSETTGLGLGVHVTINPNDAQSYFVTDGQKDIAACFDRNSSRVIAALKYDWVSNTTSMSECWQKGGTLKISKIYPDEATGKYDYLGTKGQKIEWEMVPMGELFVEEGTIPGDDPHGLTGADGTIWHPSGRWAATVVRLCGGVVILDAEKNFAPVAFVQFNKDSPDQYPVQKIDDDHWEVTFDKIFSPGHEIGFSPDGRFLCMMNNLRENNCGVFDSSDPDPNGGRSPISRTRCGAASIQTPSTWCSRSTARSSTSRCCIRRRLRAGSWWSTPAPGRSGKKFRVSARTCRRFRSPMTESICLPRSAGFSGFRAASPSSTRRRTTS